jgi:release factor glutamine methyltransferase
MPPERIEVLRRWHDAASEELHRLGAHDVTYLGLELHVPEHVFPPTPMSDLLGRAVLEEVRGGDRVLDMGTGTGVNAILAARHTDDAIGVDVRIATKISQPRHYVDPARSASWLHPAVAR